MHTNIYLPYKISVLKFLCIFTIFKRVVYNKIIFLHKMSNKMLNLKGFPLQSLFLISSNNFLSETFYTLNKVYQVANEQTSETH